MKFSLSHMMELRELLRKNSPVGIWGGYSRYDVKFIKNKMKNTSFENATTAEFKYRSFIYKIKHFKLLFLACGLPWQSAILICVAYFFFPLVKCPVAQSTFRTTEWTLNEYQNWVSQFISVSNCIWIMNFVITFSTKTKMS